MAKKRFSVKNLGTGTKNTLSKINPHVVSIATFLGLESIGKELAGAAKKKLLEEAPRGKLLSVIFELSPDTQKKLAKHLKEADKDFSENELVTLLCKLESAQKTATDPKTKKTKVVGGYKEALETMANLPNRGPGLTFKMALNLLKHDKWQQLSKRGLKVVKEDSPKKIEEQLNGFADEMEKLCDELDRLF